MSFNSEPKRLNPKYNIALMASAGTGKTYNLALRVIATLMGGSTRDFFDMDGKKVTESVKMTQAGKILCITFTKKATAEMSERVFNYLNKLANGQFKEGDAEYDAIRESLNINSSEEIKARAIKARQRIHSDSTILQIRTIDSFTSMILKLFPFEAGINPDFNLISSTNELILQKHAFNDAFKSFPEETYSGLFFKYIAWTGEQPYKFTSRIREQTDWILNRSVILRDALEEGRKLNPSQLLSILEEALENDDRIRLHLKSIYDYLSLHTSDLKSALVNRLEKLRALAMNERSFADIFDDIKYLDPAEAVKSKSKMPLEAYRRMYADFLICMKRYTEYYERLDVLILLHMAGYVQLFVDELKQHKNQLSFADITKLVYEMLHRDEFPINNDYLYFRLDGRLEHILVDEFQDTSSVQWSILKPLADEAMAGFAQYDKTGSFFCVGDPKQTIYRFRGSSPRFFHDIVNYYKDIIVRENLDVNHRSDQNIVSFVNKLFSEADSFIAETASGETLFDYTPQHSYSNKKGYVSLKKVYGDIAAEKTQARLDILGTIFDELLQNGWSASDVAILASRKADGRLAHNYLKNIKQIPSKMGFEEFLSERAAFRIVYSLVLYMATKSEFALAEFLLTPPEVVDRDKILSKTIFNRYKRAIDAYFKRSEGESVYKRIMSLGNRLSLTKRLSDDQDYYTILGIIAEKLPTIVNPLDFLNKLKNLAAQTPIAGTGQSERLDCVDILTIHGAKGLQYPVIILFNVKEGFSLNKNTKYFIDETEENPKLYKKLEVRFNKYASEEYTKAAGREIALDKLEKINKLYVATTRAKNVLYVLAEETSADNTDGYISSKFPNGVEMGELPKGEGKLIMKKIDTKGDYFRTVCWKSLGELFNSQEELVKTKTARFFNTVAYHNIITERFKEYIDKTFKQRKEVAEGEISSESYENKTFGTFLHEIIYQIEELSPSAISKAVKKVWNRYAPYLETDTAEIIESSLIKMIYDPKIQQIFSGKLFKEKPLNYKDKLYVLDLYSLSEDYVTVVDFKTSNPNTEREEEYIKQVKIYMEALAEQYQKPVKGYLLYIYQGGFFLKEVLNSHSAE